MDKQPIVGVAYGDPCEAGLPVSIGVPFPAGLLRTTDSLSAISPSGERRATSGRVLAHWPDGSIRWCLVRFGARENGPHEIRWDEAVSPAQPLSVESSDSTWTLDSGLIRLVLSETGPGPISSLRGGGHVYLDDPKDLAFTADNASTRHETRRTIRVIEQSALSARLRIEGAHYQANGIRHLSYRLDVEVWAGWPVVRLDYQFMNLEPGADFRTVHRIALEANWELGAQNERCFRQQNHGPLYLSRYVSNPAPVGIVTDFGREDAHVEDPAMLLDDTDYPFYLPAPLVGTDPWLGVHDGQHAVYCQMNDFLETRPNRIASSGSMSEVEFWPQSAGPLELQQGRTKRHTVLFTFAKYEPVAPSETGAALCHEERAVVAPEWLAHCGEYDQGTVLPFGLHTRIENNFAHFMKLDTPHSKFDVGDTDSPYSLTYSAINADLVPPLAGAPPMPRVWRGKLPPQTYLDCHEPVWTNNEYDVIHAFANEIMRTGRHALLKTLHLAARHNIEVDFLHYCDHRWLHRATPAHSARHTSTGAYPSHFWTQGLMEFYCLTGDEDALEVAVALAVKTVENFMDPEMRPVLWGFNREVGWSVLSLVHVYDVTRDERFKPLLDELVDSLITFDRHRFTGAIHLSAGNDRHDMNRQIVGNFFGYASMVDAVDRYLAITGRQDVKEWLTTFCHELAEAALQAAREGEMPDVSFGILLSVGYELTGDEKFIALMGLLLDQVYWKREGLDGNFSTKPIAMAYRGWTRMLGHAYKHGLLETHEFPSLRQLGKLN